VYLEEAFRSSKFIAQSSKLKIKNQKRLPVAKELGETSLMFMVHPTLTKENMYYVVEQARETMGHGG